MAELVGTFILVFVGCSVAVAGALKHPVAGAPYDSLAVALAFGIALLAVVAAIGHVSGGPITGGGVNPARALGPMIVSGKLDDFWVYIVGPVIGALVAAPLAAFSLKAFQKAQDREKRRADMESAGARAAQRERVHQVNR